MELRNESFEKVKRLADFVTKTSESKMKWMWGEALLGYALDELDRATGKTDYTAFLRAYCDYWAKVDPAVDQSDTAAPGLPVLSCLIFYNTLPDWAVCLISVSSAILFTIYPAVKYIMYIGNRILK